MTLFDLLVGFVLAMAAAVLLYIWIHAGRKG